MFYDVFCALCELKNKKCNTVAAEIGLSNSTVTKWKKTGATPNGKTLARISKYFGIPVDTMIGAEEELKEALAGCEKTAENAAEELRVILEQEKNRYGKENTHTENGAGDDELKFALFGGGPVTDEQFEEVKRFALYVKDRDAKSGKD